MSQRKMRRSPAMLAIFAFIASTFVVLSSQPASATGGWPVALDDIRSSVNLHTYPDGEVTVSCNGWPPAYDGPNNLQMFAADGSDLLALANGDDSWSVCIPGNSNMAGQDGMTFVVKYVNQSYSAGHLVAYQDGDELWSYPFATATCSNHAMFPEDMVVGSDGNPYFLLYYSCGGYKHDLVSVDASDGTERFRQTVSTSSNSDLDRLLAHEDGIVYYQYSKTFRYFDLDGVEDTQNSYTVSTSGNESVTHFAAQPDGTLFVGLIVGSSYAPSPCTHDVMVKVLRRSISGSVSTYDTSPHCLYVPGAWDLMPTPDGGAVVKGSTEGEHKLVFLQPGGTTTDEVLLPTDQSHSSVQYQRPWVDLNGNIVIVRQFNRQEDNHTDTHTEVLLLDHEGDQKARFSTEWWNTPNQDSFKSGYSTNGLSRGHVYLRLCEDGTCRDMADPPNLYKIPFVEVDIDYPRGVILGEVADPVQPLDYVALGDSFSSGEGVEPFIDGTDEEDENECHRSEKAYAKLLSVDPTLPLRLTDFVACSGAQSFNITSSGQWDEAKQIDALDTQTDVVTITIGGNDVLFGPTIEQCVLDWTGVPSSADCDDALDASESQVSTVDLLVETVLEDIETEVGTSTSVLVVGYPRILPEVMSTEHLARCSGWNFTNTQIERIWDLNTELNAQIAAAVSAVGGNFVFVDPRPAFDGNTACDETSYFHDINLWPNPEYTYHPNEQGQAVLAEVLKEELTL